MKKGRKVFTKKPEVPEVIHSDLKEDEVWNESVWNQARSFTGFEKKYECFYCYNTYGIHSSFMDHLKIHQQGEKKTSQKNECNVCFRVFKTELTMKLHFASNHIKYVCKTCKIQFRPQRHLDKKHFKECLEKVTVVPKNSCESEKILLKKAGLDMLLKKVTNAKNGNKVPNVTPGSKITVDCGLIPKHWKFYSEPSFDGFEIVYECSHCFKMYKQHLYKSFMRHLKIHRPKRPKAKPNEKKESAKIECKVCFKAFKIEQSMQAHFASIHVKYRCEACKKYFRSGEVKMHVEAELKMAEEKKAKNQAPRCCSCSATGGNHFVDFIHTDMFKYNTGKKTDLVLRPKFKK